MLQQNNINQIFDRTVKIVLPYIILSPPDFRNNLAGMVDTLFAFLQGGDTSITNFNKCNEHILETLHNSTELFDSTTNRRIEAFASKYKSFDERISEINERLSLLEKASHKKTEKKRTVVTIETSENYKNHEPTQIEDVSNEDYVAGKNTESKVSRGPRFNYDMHIPEILEHIKTHGQITGKQLLDLTCYDGNTSNLVRHYTVKKIIRPIVGLRGEYVNVDDSEHVLSNEGSV